MFPDTGLRRDDECIGANVTHPVDVDEGTVLNTGISAGALFGFGLVKRVIAVRRSPQGREGIRLKTLMRSIRVECLQRVICVRYSIDILSKSSYDLSMKSRYLSTYLSSLISIKNRITRIRLKILCAMASLRRKRIFCNKCVNLYNQSPYMALVAPVMLRVNKLDTDA